jgi:hypothetical protein
MKFKPFDKMRERVEVAKQDSDVSFFNNLLYLGEMLTKTVASALVSAIVDDQNRKRHVQIYHLIRADGIGEWSQAIGEILDSKEINILTSSIQQEKKELTQKFEQGCWQFESVFLLHKCLKAFVPEREDLPTKVQGKLWFLMFAELRNKTRGHGAPPASVYSSISSDFERSIQLIIDNYSLFRRSWAYLHTNLSGRVQTFKLTENISPFESLRKVSSISIHDGVYIYLDKPTKVELIESDLDTNDFFYPNGGFRGKRFELLSYITGNRSDGDGTLYLTSITKLPDSDTQGLGLLDIQGQSFGNLPPVPVGYVQRQELEEETVEKLTNTDRYPIITLSGRGGIGKTSLALTALHKIASLGQFEAIIWFSARDIDLLPEGPKPVRPNILTQEDVACEFVQLMQPGERSEKGFSSLEYLANSLAKRSLKDSFIFVFDNFETVYNPVELFHWVDTYIRLPNKVLITTRDNRFKADYPIEITGMSEDEAKQLIELVSQNLGINQLITETYKEELFSESDGHPYVIKVLLGEVAKTRKATKIERIVASKDEILDALFERTFAGLTPAAKRVFLTICGWRSAILRLSVEAVLLRSITERVDVDGAIEELRRSSFIEVQHSEDSEFLVVPLAASVFGNRKLAVSPMKTSIEADTELLQFFGATQRSGIQHGIAPRIERLFRNIEQLVSQNPAKLIEYSSMLEFIARKYPPSWLLLAALYRKLGAKGNIEKAKDAVRRYLELVPEANQQTAWEELAHLCSISNDWSGEISALLELCQIPNVSFRTISDTANRFNFFFREKYKLLASEEKQIIARRLAEIMAERLRHLANEDNDEVSATDCSRLAWLYLHLKQTDKAKHFTQLGLKLTPNDDHCLKLQRKLANQY